MKKIFASLLISCFFLSSASAATLVPNLTTQIARQEQINTKNAYTARITEIANKRAAARAKILALKNRTNKSVTPVVTSAPTKPTITPPTTVIHTTVVAQPSSVSSPQGVDMSRVRSAWLGWYNGVRQAEWIRSYSYDTRLDTTAYDWNQVFSSGKWLNHHRRNPWDSYYNFAVIDQWFISRGINPKIVNRAKHTENVWYGSYSCNSGDCTDSLIRSIRSTFDFFMSEKGKSYDAHYRSIVQPNFSRIGLSVIVVPTEQRYYLTVHYITE
jgi:hypothetical protein